MQDYQDFNWPSGEWERDKLPSITDREDGM